MAALVRRLRHAAVLLAGASFLAGCDLFKPAEPEPPIGVVIIGNYTEVDSTLATLAKAVRAKGQFDGLNAYMKGLADPALDGRSFLAEFDPATLSRFQGTVPVWGRNEEASFYANVAADDGALNHDMRWSEGDRDDPPPTDSTAVVYRKYEVFRLSASNSVTHIAYGQAEMHFFRNGRGWIMIRWIDREDPSPPLNSVSYGQLRLDNQ